MTREQAIVLLRRKQGSRSLRTFAQSIGVSAMYLSDVYNYKRDLGPKLLAVVGLLKTKTVEITYRRNGKGNGA